MDYPRKEIFQEDQRAVGAASVSDARDGDGTLWGHIFVDHGSGRRQDIPNNPKRNIQGCSQAQENIIGVKRAPGHGELEKQNSWKPQKQPLWRPQEVNHLNAAVKILKPQNASNFPNYDKNTSFTSSLVQISVEASVGRHTSFSVEKVGTDGSNQSKLDATPRVETGVGCEAKITTLILILK